MVCLVLSDLVSSSSDLVSSSWVVNLVISSFKLA